MKNPLKVTLEAECHTYEDALQLQAMLTDFVTNEKLAGEHISYAEIDYVEPKKLNIKQKKIDNMEAKFNQWEFQSYHMPLSYMGKLVN